MFDYKYVCIHYTSDQLDQSVQLDESVYRESGFPCDWRKAGNQQTHILQTVESVY